MKASSRHHVLTVVHLAFPNNSSRDDGPQSVQWNPAVVVGHIQSLNRMVEQCSQDNIARAEVEAPGEETQDGDGVSPCRMLGTELERVVHGQDLLEDTSGVRRPR